MEERISKLKWLRLLVTAAGSDVWFGWLLFAAACCSQRDASAQAAFEERISKLEAALEVAQAEAAAAKEAAARAQAAAESAGAAAESAGAAAGAAATLAAVAEIGEAVHEVRVSASKGLTGGKR